MNKHIDDTRYAQWKDGMYVMLDDLECDYELAVVEESLRGSKYFNCIGSGSENCIGILAGDGDYWYAPESRLAIKLTREQALYIATGETTCTKS